MLYDIVSFFDSFDILRDDLGFSRSAFPHTIFGVAGTQAMETSPNYIGIFKLSNMSSNTSDLVPAKKDAETPDMDIDSIEAPILQLRKVFHDGIMCRIRAMSQNPHICASWADTGYVQVWDLSSHLHALAESTDTVSNNAIAASSEAPLVKFKHEDKGYALDWSPLVPGRLVSGDCKNFIHLWEPTDATWNIDVNPFVGHTAGVYDLQWSPTMPSVFASCSGDGSIAMWDTRLQKSPTTTIKAHKEDVNVISWNRLDSNVLASESDDGSFAIWDFRFLKEFNFVERFEYHKDQITSIEWSPHKVSVLAVSSYNDGLTGRRGVHCWVCDGKARRLNNEQRAAIADYFRVYKGNENGQKKVSLVGQALHPFLSRSYTEVLRSFFEDKLLSTQNLFLNEERYEKILEMIPDESITSELRGKWMDNKRPKDDINTTRWGHLKQSLQSSKQKAQGIRRCVEEIVFVYTYPRLDMSHHLYLSIVETKLLGELNAGGLTTEGEDEFDRTSLGEAIRYFRSSFLSPLLKSCKEEIEALYNMKIQQSKNSISW